MPLSWPGMALLPGAGLICVFAVAWLIVAPVSGRPGSPWTGLAKSKAPVRSPQTWRRQVLMFGQTAGVPRAAVQVSRKRITLVWS